jgi:glutathionyl-hydroquinone reductase
MAQIHAGNLSEAKRLERRSSRTSGGRTLGNLKLPRRLRPVIPFASVSPMAVQAQFPEEATAEGEFARQEDAFRERIAADGSAPFMPQLGRYHLYVSFACPWAHRTLIVRHLKGLDHVIGVTVADPVRDERGWAFRDGPGFSHDPINGFRFLSEAYLRTRPDFRGRFTVPVLWDRCTKRIVNNSEDDICRMFDREFGAHARPDVELFPRELEDEHTKLSAFIYDNISNGVYRAGFATTQQAYERACRKLFGALEVLEQRLATRRFLLGPQPVEADWRMFCTLVRFDAVYYGHFKCNVKRIVDFPNLQGYLRDLYQQPGVADTVNIDHIKRHYYMTHDDINPTRLVPIGPVLDFTAPHTRARLG